MKTICIILLLISSCNLLTDNQNATDLAENSLKDYSTKNYFVLDTSKYKKKYLGSTYYKDFDLFKFEGLYPIQDMDTVRYPYLEFFTKQDTAYFVCYFDKDQGITSFNFLNIGNKFYYEEEKNADPEVLDSIIHRTFYGNGKIEHFKYTKSYEESDAMLSYYLKFSNDTLYKYYEKHNTKMPKDISAIVGIPDSLSDNILGINSRNNAIVMNLNDIYAKEKSTKTISLDKKYSFFWHIYINREFDIGGKPYYKTRGLTDIINLYKKLL